LPLDLPLTHVVFEEIRKRRGTVTDRELYETLRSKDPTLSLDQLERALMRLEVAGVIRVSSGGKGGTLVIEAAEGEHAYLTPDEE